MLLDLRLRGPSAGPPRATVDGALGFWAALRKVYPGTDQQARWFHMAGNLMHKMPKSVQRRAKTMISRHVWTAPPRAIIGDAWR